MSRFGRRAIVSVSMALFALCLTQDTFLIDAPDPRAWSSAVYVLALGWLGVLAGIIAWFANPLLFAAWVLFALRRYRTALALGIVALACALSFLSVEEIMTSTAPSFAKITGLGLGYWLWIAGMAAIAVGAALAALGLVPEGM